ncbi:hypothetical protein MUB24_18015 [Lederbergia sp. NSJ-179]|uniref:hypothetical protein n=1 Tax=Lederbergia sp. NSJ-179 TaxID=2931402 RepID=UPI001FCF7E9F|nr:hypothetical protein [Lederbergia sp. NSJ-179]MCJ7842739.1 hypothetical protein [Lederbergia sp. NSJ-179]
MKKIGFIDFYLDEWHANNYPTWIKENVKETGRDVEVAYAWAETDLEGGLDTASWCEKQQVQALSSIEEVVEKSDYLIVFSPDHPEHHERLGKIPLMSGKPVYMDKTFSPNLETGKRMFELAEQYSTPLYSSSALRFSKEFSDFKRINKQLEYVATTGPGTYKNYAVHQFEMIVALMGVGGNRVKSLSTKHTNLLHIEYENGRKQASFSQMQHADFQAHLQFDNGEGIWISQCSDMFPRLIDSVLTFFESEASPVSKAETLEVMALLDAGKKALEMRDTWINVKS